MIAYDKVSPEDSLARARWTIQRQRLLKNGGNCNGHNERTLASHPRRLSMETTSRNGPEVLERNHGPAGIAETQSGEQK